MLPSSRLLDVGCGPIRAGVHFISFLNAGNYYGVDYNNSFIKAASLLIAEKGLSDQHPTLRVVSDFDFSALNQQFDFVNVFSVLNHCDRQQRRLSSEHPQSSGTGSEAFYNPRRMASESSPSTWQATYNKALRRLRVAAQKYGWSEPEQRAVCPIYELGRF